MREGPITWLKRAAGFKPNAAGGKPLTDRGWTIPKTPVEVLAASLRTDRDWQIAPRRVHRMGISIGWRRAIESPFPGIVLQIDGKPRPLSLGESHLLAKSIRIFLASAPREPAA
jgi:hypothetical protein